tara:strand:- start:561 stop:734 length:174 start_codon:yes stop_codon:yes gene_type:complete
MENQEDYLITYLKEALIEAHKMTDYLIQTGIYTESNTNMPKVCVAIKKSIDRLEENN